jgi:hypothetical protein
MNNVIQTVDASNESTVVALARMCEAGSIIAHDLAETLGDDELAELDSRLAKQGLRSESTDRGIEIVEA